MARTTKVELAQANARLAADNAALRKQLGDLQASIAAQAFNETINAPRPRAQLPAHMQAAKDMAMRAGITVKVGA